MARLVFLLEERSMERFLKELLPRLCPELELCQDCVFIPHEGKQDLERSIPRKLRGWNVPDDLFVIIRDQDSGDCVVIKQHLVDLCTQAGKTPALVRIACRELESWYLGDLAAVGRTYGMPNLHRRQGSTKFRNPDSLGSPARELKQIVPEFTKLGGAVAIGKEIALAGNTSHSFTALLSGIQGVLAGI